MRASTGSTSTPPLPMFSRNPPLVQRSSPPTSQNTPSTDQKFIIAIDFGTTYSGVAFIHDNGNLGDDIEVITERIKVIKSWPNNGLNEKTKTVLFYKNNRTSWGGLVLPLDEPQITRFKLGLEESVSQHYQASNSVRQARPSRFLIFKKPPQQNNKDPVDFAADYLTCLYNYLHDKFFPSEYGSNTVRNQSYNYVVTVPAIWSDAAKNLTRQAATRAGMPHDKLTLISEPEAAALYCGLTSQVELRPGERFLICDAGGGTVVILGIKLR
jgi:molecular chaperone DnaK (HSP70)